MIQKTVLKFKKAILEMKAQDFNAIALDLFWLHYDSNPIYRQFVSNLSFDPENLDHYLEIPHLPISFYKNHDIIINGLEIEKTFLSSGTTASHRSKKHIPDLDFYLNISQNTFERHFGKIDQFMHLALLPNYLENKNSSLIYMVNSFMEKSNSNQDTSYLKDYGDFIDVLDKSEKSKTVLWGVSFALLDFAEKTKYDLSDIILIETGGMKGRQKEITRKELHDRIKKTSGARTVYSEYGMTELLSQAYSKGDESFYCPPWMKVNTVDINDPLSLEKTGKAGTLNITDLASIETCPFIATEDIGRVNKDGSFEVLGRKDHSDIRGCNLLAI